MRKNRTIPFLLSVLLALASSAHAQCSRSEYERCVRLADPLVREAHLVFPDNMDDIDLVCNTWNQFVDCIKRYTDGCFSDQQRRVFNKAVENPIQSVHQMCLQPHYQKEYLRYAPCIKNTIIQRTHCGPEYSLLVDQVEQGDIISKTTLCCSHDRFKECVQRETRKMCDRGMSDGPAARFSAQIMDKALSFLQEQCFNYIPNSGDCSSATTGDMPYSDPLVLSATSSEVYPWSTIQDLAKEQPASRDVPPRETSVSWMPSSRQPELSMLGSRTRPASYGRSNSWSEPATPTNMGANTIQGSAESSTKPSRPDWATVTVWSSGNSPVHEAVNPTSSSIPSSPSSPSDVTPTAWYPAAGYQTGNDVDEPNQQGLLSKPKNTGTKTRQILSLTVIATVLTAFC